MNEVKELNKIIHQFAQSGWDFIAIPSKEYLNNNLYKNELIEAIKQADVECGSCGCEFDVLYRRLLELKDFL